MAVPPEMKEFGLELAGQFAKTQKTQQEALLAKIDSMFAAQLDAFEAKMNAHMRELEARVNSKIDGVGKVVGEVVHEQREQKRVLKKHDERLERVDDRLERGDEQFKRVMEDIKRNHELTMIALTQRGPALTVNGNPIPAHNSVNVSNSPGVQQDSNNRTNRVLLGTGAATAGAGIGAAIYALWQKYGG